MKLISIIKGDITQLSVDAIVNAANTELRAGSGVDGAIHRAGGPAIQKECDKLNGCPTGEAVVTSGGNLKAKFVIHAVGPVWHDGNNKEEIMLASAYRNSLKRAVEKNVKTIVFPNISTGRYGFPKDRAAEIALQEVQKFLANEESNLKVTFCCFDPENYELYKSLVDG